MAEGFIRGTEGSVTLPSGFKAKVATWSFDVAAELVDVTSYSSSGWREKVCGLTSLTGSCAGVATFDAATTKPGVTAIQQSSAGSFTLTAKTGCTYTFSGYISNLRVDTSVSDAPRVTFNFESTGAVTETWDEA